jgi:hypothetical protein
MLSFNISSGDLIRFSYFGDSTQREERKRGKGAGGERE